MICYNKSIWDASVFHIHITRTRYLFILITYWVPLVNLLSYLLILSLSPLFSLVPLPPSSLSVSVFWDRILPPSPDWTRVCSHLPASSSLSLGLQTCLFACWYFVYFENRNVEILLQPGCILFIKIFAEFFYGGVDFTTNYSNKSLKVCSCKFYHLTMRALFPV